MEKCNGWTNRETWLVHLWFSEVFQSDKEDGQKITGDYIREVVESYLDDMLGRGNGDAGFIRDMMAIGAVNWEELAEQFDQ